MPYKHNNIRSRHSDLIAKPIYRYNYLQAGFTLIETIIGIVVLAIAFSIFTSLIYPLANQSAEQVHQVRAAELGQSMLNEILAKAFDENSDMSGGVIRCGEANNAFSPPVTVACSTLLGPDTTENRVSYDDVDDYNGLSTIETALGSSDGLDGIYLGFQVAVSVINDSNYDGVNDSSDNNFTAKLVTITVTTPQSFDFVFAAYRVNF